MIENTARRSRTARPTSKRRTITPSKQLRPHFIALARQVNQWAQRQMTSESGLAIGVTSLSRLAGKSTVSFNLAAALTSIARTRVLMVESDFGNPYLSRRLGIGRQPGLSEVLAGDVDLKEAAFATPLEDLFLLGCGHVAEQDALEMPFHLLTPMIEERARDYGFTVFDMPVASHLTAFHSIVPHLDGILLTVESNQIDQQRIKRFRTHVENSGTSIIGVVINKARN